jgi:hypothetical protein
MNLTHTIILNNHLKVIYLVLSLQLHKTHVFTLELQHYNPQFYEYLMKSLSQEEQGKIVEILSVAEQSRTGNQGGI